MKVKSLKVLISILLATSIMLPLLVSAVIAKPVAPNPDTAWPGGTIWGTVLHMENEAFIGEAWFGARIGPEYTSSFVPPPGDYIYPLFSIGGSPYDTDVKTDVAAPQHFSWYVELRRSGSAPENATISSVMEDADTWFVPQDFSVVLDNSAQGIFVNLRKENGYITGLTKYATLYVDNAVNIQSIENLDPLTGSIGATLRLNVYVKNTGSYTDNYVVSTGGSLDPTILNLAPGNTDNVILTTTLPNGTENIVITAAGNYATDQDYVTARGLPISVTISPSLQHGRTGDNLVYTVVVTNLGENADNFIIQITDPLMWVVPWDNAGYLSGTTDPIISEYVEGTANNKALEIYNPTSSPIDLSLYQLCLYSNGGWENEGYPMTSDDAHQLTGMLASYKTYVVVDNNASAALLAYANLIDNTAYYWPDNNPGSRRNKITQFNGDDGTLLRRISDNENIDSMGIWRIRPPTSGPTAGSWYGYMLNDTLTRKDNVKTGDVNFNDNDFAPDWENCPFAAEWDNHPTDVFTYLGWHDALGDYNKVIQLGAGENWTGQFQVVVGGTPCTTDNITVTVMAENDHTKTANATCQAHHAVAGVNVTISPPSKSGMGDTTFTVTVNNTGDNLPDNYKLENSDTQGWPLSLDNVVLGPISVGGSASTTLHVNIPISPGAKDNITVKATSVHDNTVSDNDNCQAIAIARGVSVSISPKYQENLIGGTLNYTVTVGNTGDVDDNYNLTVVDNENWNPSIVSSITVQAHENKTTTLTVTIPENAIGTTLTVTATSQDNTVKDNDICVAHAFYVRQIDKAIDNGVAWLVSKKNPNGSWGSSYPVATTGLAVLKLAEHAVDAKYGYGLPSPFDLGNPYRENMENGLNYIFLNANVVNISVQPAGNPDNNGDNKGVYFSSGGGEDDEGGDTTYETAIAMMAIAGSRAPDRVVNVPGSAVNNWKYKDVLQDAVDYLAFGQTDNNYGVYRGGWSYDANESDSDQSNAGWATFGLGFAESPAYGFMCTIPAFVKTEENYWINYIQNHDNENYPDLYGGAGYTSPTYWVNVLKTGHLLYQMEFVGDTAATPRVQLAISYIVRHWNDANQDPGWRGAPGGVASYMAMNNVMKGLSTHGIHVIDGIDWQTEFEKVLLAQQTSAGAWPVTNWDYGGDNILSTELALLTLEMVAPPFRKVDVTISPDNQSGTSGSTLTYTVTVKNIGSINDNYILTVSGGAGWGPSISPNVLTVPAGGDRTATLNVTVQSVGTSTTITVTARSLVDPSVSDSASCTATAQAPSAAPKVSVSISPSARSGSPGTKLSYTVTVTNTGGATDTFDLSISGGTGWSPKLSNSSLTLAADASGDVTLEVTVPIWAATGLSTTITVTATSTTDLNVSASTSCRTTVSAPTPGPVKTTPTGMSLWALLVIAGALLAIILLSLFILFGAYRRRRKKKSSST